LSGKEEDRRVRRTRALLHEALGALIREKAYDRITVADILGRAGISRSTFYIHFRDKDDLLASSMRALLFATLARQVGTSPGIAERTTAFSLPLLTHIQQHRRTAGTTLGGRGRAILHGHLRDVLAEWIANSMGPDLQRRRPGRTSVAPALLARHIASTFVLVLHWWLDEGSGASPGAADELFRALVTPVLDRL
jgi:AcrR family transcriptional regulator